MLQIGDHVRIDPTHRTTPARARGIVDAITGDTALVRYGDGTTEEFHVDAVSVVADLGGFSDRQVLSHLRSALEEAAWTAEQAGAWMDELHTRALRENKIFRAVEAMSGAYVFASEVEPGYVVVDPADQQVRTVATVAVSPQADHIYVVYTDGIARTMWRNRSLDLIDLDAAHAEALTIHQHLNP